MTVAPINALRSKPAPPRASSILELGFSTGLQRPWLWLIRVDIPKQGGDPYSQHVCKGFQRGNGDVLRTALDPADIGAVDARRQRQPFLRKALGHPKAAEVPANGAARIHAEDMNHITGLTIDGLLVPYCNFKTNGKQIRMNAYIDVNPKWSPRGVSDRCRV